MSARPFDLFAAILDPLGMKRLPAVDVPARDSEGQRQLTPAERTSQLQWQLRAAEARRQAELFDAEALLIDLESGDDCAMAIGHHYAAAARELVAIENLQRELRARAGNAPRATTGD